MTEDEEDSRHPQLEGPLSAVIHYDVGELFVRRDELSTVLTFERHGSPIEISLPDDQMRFRRPSHFRKLRPGSRVGDDGTDEQLLAIPAVQVVVALGKPMGDEGSGNAELMLLREADEIAWPAVRALLDWMRTRDEQVWLLPGHERVKPTGEWWLEDAAGNRSWTSDAAIPLGIVLFSVEQAARIGRISAVAPEMLSSGSVPVPEALLADAQWAIWPTNDPDPRRAALLAAIALEIKVPQALTQLVTDDARALLETVLRRHDEVPMSVKFMLNDLSKSVTGRSLKAEDGELDKAMKELYRLRNDVAHRGEAPDVQEARAAVVAAERVFEWLDLQLAEVRAKRGDADGLTSE